MCEQLEGIRGLADAARALTLACICRIDRISIEGVGAALLEAYEGAPDCPAPASFAELLARLDREFGNA